jgi:hypothetical protein
LGVGSLNAGGLNLGRLRLGVGIAGALVFGLAGVMPASGADDFAGRWVSDSLRDNRVGCFFNLKPAPNVDGAYVGVFRFAFQDGRRSDPLKIRVVTKGEQMTMRASGGKFDKSAGGLVGVIEDDGSKIRLTNCQQRLRFAMAGALDSDCVFRPAR